MCKGAQLTGWEKRLLLDMPSRQSDCGQKRPHAGSREVAR